MASDQAFKHLTFPIGERFQTAVDRRFLGLTLAVNGLGAEGQANGTQKDIVIKRFLDKVQGSGLHSFYCKRHIAVARDHDDGQGYFQLSQALQEFDPAHAGHSHIGHNTADLDLRQCGEKVRGIRVSLNLKILSAQQKCHRVPHGFVVVNHVNNIGIRRHLLRPPR